MKGKRRLGLGRSRALVGFFPQIQTWGFGRPRTVSAWFGRRKFLRYFKPHSLFKCMPTSAHLHPKRVASAPLLLLLLPLPLLFFSTKSHNRMGSKHTLHDATTLPLFSSSSPSRSSFLALRLSSPRCFHHHSPPPPSSSSSSSSVVVVVVVVRAGISTSSSTSPSSSFCRLDREMADECAPPISFFVSPPHGEKSLLCACIFYFLYFHSKIRNLIVRQNGRTIKFCTQNIILKNGTALLSSVRCFPRGCQKSPPHHHSSRNTRMMESSWSSSVSRCLPRDNRQRQHPRGRRRRRRQKRRRSGPTRSGDLPNENENNNAQPPKEEERRREKDVGGNRDDRGEEKKKKTR